MLRNSAGLVRSSHNPQIRRIFEHSTSHFRNSLSITGYTIPIRRGIQTNTETLLETEAVRTNSNIKPDIFDDNLFIKDGAGLTRMTEMDRDDDRARMENAMKNDLLQIKASTFPWLVKKLSSSYPEIAHVSMPPLLNILSDTRALENILRDILNTANDAMISIQVPASVRITCVIHLADDIVHKIGSGAVNDILPESWTSVVEYLEGCVSVDIESARETAVDNVISNILVHDKASSSAILQHVSSFDLFAVIRRMRDVVRKIFRAVGLGKHSELTVKLLANMNVVWPLLKSDKGPVPEMSPYYPELLSTITLPKGHHWPFGIGVGHTLFVRSSQKSIPDEIMSGHEKFTSFASSQGSDTDNMGHGYIIKGTPGIGKTTLLNLLIYMASKLDVDVVIHNPVLFLLLMRRDGTVTAYKPTEIDDVDELALPGTLYLFDPHEGTTQAKICPAFTVIATSPNVKHYEDHRKLYMEVRWLSPWTLKELFAAHYALQPDGRLTEEQRMNILDRFEYFGGSLRKSFGSETDVRRWMKSMDRSIAEVTLEMLKYYKTVIEKESGVANDSPPHVLLHCFPLCQKVAEDYVVAFASARSGTMISEALAAKKNIARKDLVDIMVQLDPSPISRGFKYEHNFHTFMSCFGHFPVASLARKLDVFDHAGNYDSTLSVVPKVCKTNRANAAVVDALVRNECTYVIPTQHNFPLVDSFYINDSTVYCLQVTTSRDHDFKSENWDELRNDIQSAYETARSQNMDESKMSLTFKYCWVHDKTEPSPEVKEGFYSLPYKNIFPKIPVPSVQKKRPSRTTILKLKSKHKNFGYDK